MAMMILCSSRQYSLQTDVSKQRVFFCEFSIETILVSAVFEMRRCCPQFITATGLLLLLGVGGGSGAGVAPVTKSAYTPHLGINSPEPDQVNIYIVLLRFVFTFSSYKICQQCKIEGFLRCERVDVDFEVIKTVKFLTIEGVKFKRTEAREEEEYHAGMYSFIAHETGGLAVFIIGLNDKNLTQVKTSS